MSKAVQCIFLDSNMQVSQVATATAMATRLRLSDDSYFDTILKNLDGIGKIITVRVQSRPLEKIQKGITLPILGGL